MGVRAPSTMTARSMQPVYRPVFAASWARCARAGPAAEDRPRASARGSSRGGAAGDGFARRHVGGADTHRVPRQPRAGRRRVRRRAHGGRGGRGVSRRRTPCPRQRTVLEPQELPAGEMDDQRAGADEPRVLSGAPQRVGERAEAVPYRCGFLEPFLQGEGGHPRLERREEPVRAGAQGGDETPDELSVTLGIGAAVAGARQRPISASAQAANRVFAPWISCSGGWGRSPPAPLSRAGRARRWGTVRGRRWRHCPVPIARS